MSSSIGGGTPVFLMSTLAVKAAMVDHIIPQFEQTTGYRVDALFDPTNVLQKRVAEGQMADVLIATDVYVSKLNSEHRMVASTVAPLVKTGVGVAIAMDAPSCSIDSVDAFRNMLCNASSVAYSRTGASGVYFAKPLDRLGIADQIAMRSTIIEKGFTGECIVQGIADVAIQQMSELHAVRGIRVLGPLPEEIQSYTDFWIGMFAGRAQSESTNAFVQFLKSAFACTAYEALGLTVL